MKTDNYICTKIIPNHEICNNCNHINYHDHIDTCDHSCTLNKATCKTKNEIRKLKLKKLNAAR